MVSSMVGGWGCRSSTVVGAAPTGLPRVVGRRRDPWVWVLFVGGASAASEGRFWHAKGSALQGQGRWAFGFRTFPGVGRRGRGVQRGVGAVLAFAS